MHQIKCFVIIIVNFSLHIRALGYSVSCEPNIQSVCYSVLKGFSCTNERNLQVTLFFRNPKCRRSIRKQLRHVLRVILNKMTAIDVTKASLSTLFTQSTNYIIIHVDSKNFCEPTERFLSAFW